MSTRSSSLHMITAACVALCTAAPMLIAAPIDLAKQHFDAGDFSKVDEVLKDELELKAPDPATLRLSLAAAQKAGKLMTAEKRMKLLLKTEREKDANLLYEGAVLADSIGDESLALARFQAYAARKAGGKDGKVRESLRYLLDHGTYPEEYRQFVTDFGATREAWRKGTRQLSRLIEIPDRKNVLVTAGFMMKQFPEPYQVRYVHAQLWWAAEGFRMGQKTADRYQEPMDLIFTSPVADDLSDAWQFLSRVLAASDFSIDEKVDYLFRFQEYANRPLSADRVYQFYRIRELKSSDAQKKAAGRYLKFEDTYKNSKDREDYNSYMRIILTDAAAAFTGIVPPNDAATRFDVLAAKFSTDPRRISSLIAPARSNFMGKDAVAETAFLKKHTTIFSPADFERLMVLQKSQGFDATLAAVLNGRSHGEKVVFKWKVLKALAAADRIAAIQTAAADYMSAYPGSFEWQSLNSHVIRNDKITADDRVKLIQDIAIKGGYGPPLQALIKDMAADRTRWEKVPSFQSIRNGEKENKKGSDAAMSAHVALCLDKSTAKALATSKAFLAAYKGKVPADVEHATNQAELQAAAVFEQHLSLALGNRKIEDFDEFGILWAPRLGDGAGWEGMISFARDRRRYDILYPFAKHYLAANKGEGVPDHIWYDFRYTTQPNAEAPAVLGPYYAKMPPKYAYDYAMYNVDQGWRDRPDIVMQELAKIVPLPDFQFSRKDYVRDLINWLRDRAKTDRAVPVALTGALYKMLQEHTGLWNGFDPVYESRICDIYNRSGQQKELEQHLTAYYQAIATRSRGEQIEARWQHLGLHPREDSNQPLQANGRLGVLLKQVKPLFDKPPVLGWMDASFGVRYFDELRACAERSFQAEKDSASRLRDSMISALLQGAKLQDTYAFSGLTADAQELCKSVIGESKWPDVNAMLTGYAHNLRHLSGDSWLDGYNRHMAPVVEALEAANAQELAHIFLERVTKETTPPDEVSKQIALAQARVSRFIPDMISVPRTDPTYEMHLAALELARGNESRAWELTSPRLKLVRPNWETFDHDYVVWCIEQMSKQRMHKDALDLAFTVLLRELDLPADTAARVSLAKGDIYSDMQNFQAARIEYESLMNNRRLARTDGGSQAMFRLIDLSILTKDYPKAETMLERLIESKSVAEQAEAFFYFAKMSFVREDYDAAKDYLKEVGRRVLNHVEAALLEGELKLKLKKLENPEVMVGNPRLATVLIPGRILTLKLQDLNLSVARSGASIPVIITTKPGGDEERVRLVPDSSNKTLFKGTIVTALGAAQKSNVRLEVTGEDEVSYMIDPEFQKANDLDYPPKLLEVRADGELRASSGEILTKEEAEQRAYELRLLAQEGALTKRMSTRDTIVRPGSQIYVQVTDLDQDRGAERDDVMVTLRTTSGDVLSGFPLKETGAHTGLFEGAVPTGLPYPRAMASDTEESGDPNVMINSTKPEAWHSLADGKKPKWIEVDLMNSANVKQAALRTADNGQIKSVRLLGLLADDYEELAAFPESAGAGKDGLHVDIAEGYNSREGDTPDGIRKYMRLAKVTNYTSTKPMFERATSPFKDRRWISARMKGLFYVTQNRFLELKLEIPHTQNVKAYVFIDGELLLADANRPQRMHLLQGCHKFELLTRNYDAESVVSVLFKQPDGTFLPLPSASFDAEKSPALVEHLRSKGTITFEKDQIIAKLHEPERLRSLRWVFDDFTGNSASVMEMSVTDDKDTLIVPGTQDFTSGTANRILEISPGDEILITYEDERSLRASDNLLTATLDTSFYNGDISVAHEVFTDQPGRRSVSYLAAKRCRAGDQMMIMVVDHDADLTDQRDALDVTVKTSSGETATLKALETSSDGREEFHRHAGQFLATLKFGETTDKDTVKIVDGDLVTVSYVDNENTDPGVPIARSYSIVEAGRQEPQVTVYRTSVRLVKDTSELAEVKIRRIAGRTDEEMEIMTEQVVARDPTFKPEELPDRGGEIAVSVNTPLLFEVCYPRMALHEGSVIIAEAVAESEVVAAKAEERDPTVLEIPIVIKNIETRSREKGTPIELECDIPKTSEDMLAEGSFAGVVRLQIGAPGDTVDDMVTTTDLSFGTTAREPQDDERYRVPTLLVSGSDTVHLTVRDETSREVVAEQDVRLLSDARLELLDRSYVVKQEAIYLGDRFFLRLTDPDRDASDEHDVVHLKLTSAAGDECTAEMKETMPHSGVFTGSIEPVFAAASTAGGATTVVDKSDANLQVNFGDEVTFQYIDQFSVASAKPVQVIEKGKIHFGTDSETSLFSKRFRDPEMAVKTRFLMAEALFEMAKQHRALEQPEKADEEIAEAKRILTEAMRDYPDTSLAAQGEYLLSNLAQENGLLDEAVARYSRIISTWPDSEYAAKSQLKKAICYEKLENYDQACEEYVKLTYLYPDSPYVADATVRLANYYYSNESFDVASRVFASFQKNSPEHELAPKCLFLAAQCQIKLEEFERSAELLGRLAEEYKDDKDLRAEAMYWQADSFYQQAKKLDGDRGRSGGKFWEESYKAFKRLTWDYPESKWAKFARGRLAEEQLIGVDMDLRDD